MNTKDEQENIYEINVDKQYLRQKLRNQLRQNKFGRLTKQTREKIINKHSKKNESKGNDEQNTKTENT
tara:strand:- start:130 stop:333 length:204 start_codon:yes stop_codon:yes gene_type:complete